MLPEKERAPSEAEPSPKEKLELFAQRRSFTPRETEVFEALVTGDAGVQEIADGMHISRRVLQRYISSIYEKTGAKSRIGLFQMLAKENESM